MTISSSDAGFAGGRRSDCRFVFLVHLPRLLRRCCVSRALALSVI
jgi:hypothetical protein